MSGGGGGDGKTPTLNVVSLVDVIFNVIVFFIITAKAASEENVNMVVPKVNNPTLHPMPREVPKLTVSAVCNAQPVVEEMLGRLRKDDLAGAMAAGSPVLKSVQVGGKEFKIKTGRPEEFAPVTAAIKEIAAVRLKGAPPGTKLEVILRADIGSQYDQVFPVMDAIRNAGQEKVNLVCFKK